jgi:hypothetical protein
LFATNYTLRDNFVTYSEIIEQEGWLSGYDKRRKITIDNTKVSATLSDFPVYLKIGSSAGIGTDDLTDITDDLGSSTYRKKIAVTTSNGTSQCNVEIAFENIAGGVMELHVRVPSISSSEDTLLYIYWDSTLTVADNANVGDIGEAAGQAVWEPGFAGVWHMQETYPDDIVDSTGNGNAAQPANLDATNKITDGKLNGAYEYPAINEYSYADDDATLDLPDAFTIECWLRHTSMTTHTGWYLDKGTNDNVFENYGAVVVNGEVSLSYKNGAFHGWQSNDTPLSNSTWQHVVCKFTSAVAASAAIFVDGVESSGSWTSGTGTLALITNTAELRFARSRLGTTNYDGDMDEIRVHNVNRSDSWVVASYHTQKDNFVTYSTFETEPTDKAWLTGYDKRAKVTIDRTKVDEDLIDFPVYIPINSSAGISDTDITALLTDLSMTGGSDTYAKKMAVTSGDGVTILFVEWDHILTGSDSGLHVKVPFIDASENTELYIYWDSSKTMADNDYVGVTGDWAAQQVWDLNFIHVGHFNSQVPSTFVVPGSDDLNYNTDLTHTNMDATNLVAGKNGKGIDFNGTDESQQTGTSTIYTSIVNITIEHLSKRTGTKAAHTICQYGKAAGQSWGMNIDLFTGNLDKSEFNFYDGAWRTVRDPNTHNIDQWYYWAGRYDKVTMDLFRQDSKVATVPYTGALQYNNPFGFRVGAYQATAPTKANFFEGVLDELRISRIARSDGWIKATYHTLWDNLVSIGATVTSASPPSPTDLSPADWLTGYNRRRRVNIDPANIDENLTDFPVLININSSSGPDNIDLSDITNDLTSTSNRKKIAVTTSDGETQCYVEIAYEDIANDKMELYVKVPTVFMGKDTPLFIYWHSTNSVADNTTYVGDTGDSAADNVWDSDFVGVWHLTQEPSGSLDVKESTGLNLDGTTVNLVTANWIDTPLGKGYEYDQTPLREYVEVGYNSVMAFTDYITLESFDKFVNAARPAERQIDSGNQTNTQNPFALLPLSGKPGFSYRGTNGVFYTYDADVAQIVAGEWAHHAAIHTNLDGSKTATFFDGTRLAGAWQSGTGDVGRTSLYDHLRFGTARTTGDPWQLIGAQSEVRISKVIRSDAWIKATAKSLHDEIVGFGMTLSVPTDETLNNPDWPDGWDGKRLQVQIDHTLVDGPLTDFPICYSVDGAAGINEVDSRELTEDLATAGNRKKVMFLDEAGNKLYAEIEEKYDMSLDIMTFHVKVPKVCSAINTVLWVHWDAAHASETTYIGDLNETPAEAVWSNGFIGVWHMHIDVSDGDDIHDSTGITPDSSRGTTGSVLNQVQGVNNSKGITFNKDNALDQNHWSVDPTTEMEAADDITVEAIAKRTQDHPLSQAVCQLGKDQGQSFGINSNRHDTAPNKMGFHLYSGAWYNAQDPNEYDAEVWYHWAGSYDEATLKFFRNGVMVASAPFVGVLDYTTTHRWNMGVYSVTYSTWADWFSGAISEVRLSNVARSAEWNKATYHSMFDSLLILDEAGPEGAPAIPPFEPDASDTYTPYNATELTVDGDNYQNNGPLVNSEYWYNVGGPIPNLPSGWNIMAEPLAQDTTWQITTEQAQDSGWNIQTELTPQDTAWTIIYELKQDVGWNVLKGVLGYIQQFYLKCINFVFDVEEVNAHCVDETDDVREMVPLKSEFCLKNSHQDHFEITRVINENVFILN